MSKRFLTTCAALASLLSVFSDTSRAQTLQVVDKPGDGEWTVSFSRKDNPNSFELDKFCKDKVGGSSRDRKTQSLERQHGR